MGAVIAVLAAGLPALVLGKVRYKSEKALWIGAFVATTLYQFGLIAFNIFGKIAILHFGAAGFWVTLLLFVLMYIPTVMSFMHLFVALKSYFVLSTTTWSRTGRSVFGLRSLLRWRCLDNGRLFAKMYQEFDEV